MKIFIVNSQINNTSKELLNRYGNIAEVAAHDMLPYAEKHHADMQFARIDGRTLVCAPGSSCNVPLTGLNVISGSVNLKEKYPDNIAYNILRAGNLIFHNTKYTAPEITELARLKNVKIIHTKQGYAGCSTISVPLSDGSSLLVSSDKGLIDAANKINTNELHTEYFEDTDSIILSGYDHGFIGGCCGYDKDLGLILYGKANGQLKSLSERYNFPIFSIYDGPITDIGGILVMYPYL